MAQAILKFKLPEEKDDHYFAINGLNYFCVIKELDDFLRSELKYNDKFSKDKFIAYEELREKIRTLCEDNEVTLEK